MAMQLVKLLAVVYL